jgi:hypothetical protein
MKGIHYETNQPASRSILLPVLTSSIRGHFCSFRSVFEKSSVPYALGLHPQSTAPRSRILQCVASFLAGGGVSGALGRAYSVWWSGEGWVFICLELQYDKVNCIYWGGEHTLEQTWRCRCTSDSLLAYRLKIPWQNPSSALLQLTDCNGHLLQTTPH